MKRTRLYQWLFVVPALLYIALFFLYPVVQNVLMGFQDYTTATFYTGKAPFIGLDNYQAVISDATFWPTVRNTFVFVVCSVLAQFVLGMLIANFFKKKFPLGTTLRSLLLLPWLLPVIVSTALWRSLMDQDSGAINAILESVGIIDTGIPWLSSPAVALISVIIVNVWIGIPFNVTIIYGGLQEIPDELYEASAMDGAGPFRTFRSITWPLLRPTVNVVVLLGVIYTLRSLDIILGLTRGGPANSTQTLPTQSYFQSFQQFEFGQGAALSNILILISFVFAFVYLRSNRRSITD
ncbi:MAG: multiple sugar transport system permease protein [Subtercola sp.]|nr:multiple sugar transport system permease protein [Subtercola sp.]